MSEIEIRNVSFRYGDEPLISELSTDIQKAAFIAIAGPNGVGKSTLLKLLCNQLKPEHGEIKVNGRDIGSFSHKQLSKLLAVVRQEFTPAFGFSVYETVLMARTPYFNLLGFETQADTEIVQSSLEATEISHLANRELNHLSGGERQRVFIARALAQNTPILLLDEPTSFLDLKHQVGVYDLLKKLQVEESKTIITVTHNLNIAAQYCDQILLLGGSGRHYLASPDVLYDENRISEVFGVKGITAKVDNKNIFLPIGKFWGLTP